MSNEKKTLSLRRKKSGDCSTPKRSRRDRKVEVIVKKRSSSPKPSKVATKGIDKSLKKPRIQTPPQKKKKGPAQPSPKIRMPVSEATRILQEYWPNLFDGDQIKPLQVGILNHLKEDARERNLPISGKIIKRCLSILTYTFEYRFSIQSGQPRYDKDGQVCGSITEGDEIDSKSRILRTLKQQRTINPFVIHLGGLQQKTTY